MKDVDFYEVLGSDAESLIFTNHSFQHPRVDFARLTRAYPHPSHVTNSNPLLVGLQKSCWFLMTLQDTDRFIKQCYIFIYSTFID